jgi:hypothetical protein
VRNNKAQSSVEYIVIVSMALLIIIPASFIFYNYVNSSKVSLLHSQVFNVGNNLVDTAIKVYSIGDNSWQTIKITIPDEVKEITIYNYSDYSELIINYGIESVSDGVFFSDIQLCSDTNCSCTNGCEVKFYKGQNKFRVFALDGKIYYKVIQ